MSRARVAAALAIVSMPSVAAAAEVTVTVNPDGGADYTSLQEAIDLTSPDDQVTIQIAPGVYPPAAIARSGPIAITSQNSLDDTFLRGIRVTDAGADVVVIQVQITDEGASVERGSLALEDLRISNPGSTGAPAVRVGPGATSILDTVLIEGWRDAEAPVQLGPGATADFDMVGIFNCEGSRAGAIWSRGADANFATLFTADTQAGSGAGSVNIEGGSAIFTDSSIEGASGTRGGGIRIAGDANVAATDIAFADNEAPEGGHVRLESGTLSMVRSTAIGGDAQYGGVFWQGGGSADIRNAAWDDNHALQAGAAIYQQEGGLEVAFSTFTRMASAQGTSAHNGPAAATYNGVIIADTQGPALAVSPQSTVSYREGLIWAVDAAEAIEGTPTYDPNEVFAPPRFADADAGDYALTAISAGLDLGVDDELDPDGTAADAGMYGGGTAWALPDRDGDGFVHGRDCVDVNADIHEGAVDVFYDGIDANCDYESDYDQDGDGFDATLYAGGDCDDTNAAIYPDAVESGGDAIDVDCDGFDYPDSDADGWPADLDCDDGAADVAPDAEDDWYDGIDSDCAGNDDFDQDGDGYAAAAYGGRDCDDTDAHRHPMYPDYAGDGIDQDCDGRDAVAEDAPEDEVTKLSPAPEPESALAPAAMGSEPEVASGTVSSGCSVTAASGSGAFGLLGLVSLVGLIGRRRE